MGVVVPFRSRVDDFHIYRFKSEGKFNIFIIDPRIGIFEEAQSFIRLLGHSQIEKTVRGVGYILVGWLNYLRSHGVTWSQASRKIFRTYLSNHVAAKNRRARVANVIWRWYRFLADHELYSDASIEIFEQISGPSKTQKFGQPISKGAVNARKRIGKRPIQKEKDIADLYNHALANRSDFKGERDWLIIQLMGDCGLRAIGISNITVRMISFGMAELNVMPKGCSVLEYHGDRKSQASIRAKIDKLRSIGRSGVIVVLSEKNGKVRDVLIKFDLLISILDYLWGDFVKENRLKRSDFSKAVPLFMSKKRNGPLEPGSVSDIVKALLAAAGLKGGGHSLRAGWITGRAVELIKKIKKPDGKLFDMHTVGTVLADEAGHADPETLESYLDAARVKDAFGERDKR